MQPSTLKIGFVLDTSLDPPDGVQQYILALSSWFSRNGHDVHFLVGQTKRTDLANVHNLSKNFSVTFNGNKTTIPLWANKREVRQLLAAEKFDVLHVQTPHHPFMAQRVVSLADERTAVFGTFHILPYGRFASYATRLLGFMLKPSLKRFDTMLAVSPAAAVFEKWAFGRDAVVLPNVVDYARFSSAEPFQKYDDNVLTVLFLGRLVERKGCKTLLEAISLLDRQVLPKFRMIICGKGELLASLQEFAVANGLEDVVEFVGFVTEEDKPRYYASADISVFPSSSGESFGIVLLEAMASGKSAVLAGNNPGYSSVMEPKPELLFNPLDADLLAEQLRAYLTNAALRSTAAAWGQTYTKDFDIEAVGPKLLKEYQIQVAKRQTP